MRRQSLSTLRAWRARGARVWRRLRTEEDGHLIIPYAAPGGDGLVGHGYTVTHYVLPFAAVSGATSDLEDRGAAAWTNATSVLAPTTIGTALARAVGGNITELAPGTYIGPRTAGATTGIFTPATAGTLGNLNIFTARYPAAYNLTSRSQFKRTIDIPPCLTDYDLFGSGASLNGRNTEGRSLAWEGTSLASWTIAGGGVTSSVGPAVATVNFTHESTTYRTRVKGVTTGTATTDRFGAAVRWNEAGSAGYYAYIHGGGSWSLRKFDGTELATGVIGGFSAATQYTLDLDALTDTTTTRLDVVINGEIVGTANDATHSAVGKPGIYLQGTATLTEWNSETVTSCPIFGYRNYVVWDGAYTSYADGGMPHTRGIYYLGYDLTGCEVRRIRADRTNLNDPDDGDNYNVIQLHSAFDAKVRDCLVVGGFDATGSRNESVLTCYGAHNVVISNNELRDVTTGIFVKGTGNGGNYGLIEKNKITGVRYGITPATTAAAGVDTMTIKHNLIIGAAGTATGALLDWDNASATESRYFVVEHNTIIGKGDEELGQVAVDSGSLAGTGNRFRHNITAKFLGSTQVTVNIQGDVSGWAEWNYNRYYENGNTVQYHSAPTTYNGVAAWTAGTGLDANSTDGDPGFVDQAAGNYRLVGGSPCLTLSSTGGPIGCYIDGTEEVGLRAAPSY